MINKRLCFKKIIQEKNTIFIISFDYCQHEKTSHIPD